MMFRMLTTMATYIGYFALSALLSEAESAIDTACRNAKAPTVFI